MLIPNMYCKFPTIINTMLKRHRVFKSLGYESYKLPQTMPEMLALALYATNLFVNTGF